MSAGQDRLTARLLGVPLAVAACNPPRVLGGGAGWLLIAVAALAAWWAAPMVDARPVLNSMRWTAVAAQRRTTLLAAGCVVLAALTGPDVWLAGCVTGLLTAYLLVTDVWMTGSTVPAGTDRATPALAAVAAAAVVFLAATAPLGDTSWARLPAALVLAATGACVALALRHRRGSR